MALPSSTPSDFALVVEGPDDKHIVLQTWFRYCGLDPDRDRLPFRILDKEGKDNILSDVGIEVKEPGRRAVGFVLDADDDPNGCWLSVQNRLRDAGVAPPGEMQSGGTIVPADEFNPRVGVWIMPDNRSPGELEDYVARMVPKNDLTLRLSHQFISSIPHAERRFTYKKSTRAIVHAWLAVRKDPSPMGLAIRTKDLEIDGELSTRFIEWLVTLFETEDDFASDE